MPVSEVAVIVGSDDPRKALPSSPHLTALPGQAATVGRGLLRGDQAIGLVSIICHHQSRQLSYSWPVFCRFCIWGAISQDLISCLLPQRLRIHTESFNFNRFWVRAMKYLIVLEFPHLHHTWLLRQLEVKAAMLSLVYCYNDHWKTIIVKDGYIYIWWCIHS